MPSSGPGASEAVCGLHAGEPLSCSTAELHCSPPPAGELLQPCVPEAALAGAQAALQTIPRGGGGGQGAGAGGHQDHQEGRARHQGAAAAGQGNAVGAGAGGED